MKLKLLATSIFFFIIAALLEIGGGWLVWQWLREGRGWWLGLIGGILLMLYGIVPTFQPAHFGQVWTLEILNECRKQLSHLIRKGE